MKAHLARHMYALHGAKRKAATGRARGKRRGPGRPRGSFGRKQIFAPTIMGSASSSAAGLLGNMQNYQAELMEQKSAIDRQIEAVAQAIEVMGSASGSAPRIGRPRMGRPRGRGRGRPKNAGAGRAGSLKDYIVRVLNHTTQPLSPRDIGQRVKQAGFSTKSKDLTKAVSNTLPDLRRVKRVGFGRYRLG